MLDRKHGLRVPASPRLYAQAVVETVKIGVKRFRVEVAATAQPLKTGGRATGDEGAWQARGRSSRPER